MIIHYNPHAYLPTAEDLPNSDDTPVDNELQNLIPNMLEGMLVLAWAHLTNWFFGVDMGIYYNPDLPPLVPDGFLSLGVERFTTEDLRLSYVLWQEQGVVPILMLEVVSKTRNREYSQKKLDYARFGVLYYVIYAPPRRRKERLEVYRLMNGEYVLQLFEPEYRVWLPEIGLAIGRDRGTFYGRTREWLYWYDEAGNRLPTPEEWAAQVQGELQQSQIQLQQTQVQAQQAQIQAQQAQAQLQQAQKRADRLAAKLRALNLDPDDLE